MQDLMSKQEFNFSGTQHLDEAAIVIKVTSVCGSSWAPFVSIYQLQSSGQVAKETGLEQ
jgi:hypothetical protein